MRTVRKFWKPITAIGGVAMLGLVFSFGQLFLAALDRIDKMQPPVAETPKPAGGPTTVVVVGSQSKPRTSCRPSEADPKIVVCEVTPKASAPAGSAAPQKTAKATGAPKATVPKALPPACEDGKPFGARDPRPCDSRQSEKFFADMQRTAP